MGHKRDLPLIKQVISRRYSWRLAYIKVALLFLLCIAYIDIPSSRNVLQHSRSFIYHQLNPQSSQQLISAKGSSAWVRLAEALHESRPAKDLSLQWRRKGSHDLNISIKSGKNNKAADMLSMSRSSIRYAQQSHASFVRWIQEGDAIIRYRPESRGVVIAASKGDLLQILASIRLLRRTGSELPVEIIFPEEKDQDALFCTKTIRKMRARCRSLEDAIKDAPIPAGLNSSNARKIKMDEPLYKLLAIFTSEFEEVLYLDASTLVINNPSILFKQEPFLSTGLVMWPDVWYATPSKLLLQLQNEAEEAIDAEEARNILTSSSQGRNVRFTQLLISKRIQKDSLLLAIYYNFYGPLFYDLLLQQASFGKRGDSSILAAARFLEKDHYMVMRLAEAAGYPDKDREGNPFRTTSMVFCSPSDDFHQRRPDWHLPFFVSTVGMRADAQSILASGVSTFKSAAQGGHFHHRIWEWFSGRRLPNGWGVKDPEQAFWQELSKVACEDAHLFDKQPKGSDMGQICEKAQEHYKALWPTSS
jgi:hypothetical protein